MTVAEHVRAELGEVERKLEGRTASLLNYIRMGFDLAALDLADVARLVRHRDVLLHLLNAAEDQ